MENEANNRVEWAASTNIYEVNIRQYTPEGTFNAFARSLPRLRMMSVETLWLMPIQPVGIKNRKGTLGSYYSISDYKGINPEFGTLADFKDLVKTAQGMGFKVIIDWVANHTSWDHVWTQSHPEFYTKDSSGGFRPPFPDWADVIDLDYNNRDLWNAMIEDMKYWVTEAGIDGFRCDMAHLVPLEFWKVARQQLDSVKPLFWLAETEEPSYHEAFDASYTWEFLHKMESFWKRETDIAGLDSVLYKYDSTFSPNAIRMYFTSNHDENSHSGSEYERMGSAAEAFAVLTATWNGIPLVYSGQELPNKSRLQFFEKDTIDWIDVPRLHDFYSILLRLHKNHPALRAADNNVITYRVKTSSDENVFAFLRRNGSREVLVILNLSNNEDLKVTLLDDRISGTYADVFNGGSVNLIEGGSERTVSMSAWGYFIFQK